MLATQAKNLPIARQGLNALKTSPKTTLTGTRPTKKMTKTQIVAKFDGTI